MYVVAQSIGKHVGAFGGDAEGLESFNHQRRMAPGIDWPTPWPFAKRPRPPWPLGGLSPMKAVRLTPEGQQVRADWRCVAFEVRVRGRGNAMVSLLVGVQSDPEDSRLGGNLDLEDESAAGAWIEVEHARQVRSGE